MSKYLFASFGRPRPISTFGKCSLNQILHKTRCRELRPLSHKDQFHLKFYSNLREKKPPKYMQLWISYQESFITLRTVKLGSQLPRKTVQSPSQKISRPNCIKPCTFLFDPIAEHALNRKLDQGLPEVFYSLCCPAFIYIASQ